MDSQQNQHVLVSGIVSFLFGFICLGIWAVSSNSANTYLPAGAAFFGLLIIGSWVVCTIRENRDTLRMMMEREAEYLYLRYYRSPFSGGKYSPELADELIRSGSACYCGFCPQSDSGGLWLVPVRTWIESFEPAHALSPG